MKWRLFFQIVILLLIAGIIFYFVCPKYYFFIREGVGGIRRGNKITGEVMVHTHRGWIELK